LRLAGYRGAGPRPASKRRLCIVALLACLQLSASEHRGQVNFGGLPVPGATVTATQGAKTMGTITDQQGAYAFADLPDGAWTIKVEMQCFATIKQEINIAPNAPAAEWNLKLLPLTEIQAAAGPVTAPVAPPPPAPRPRNAKASPAPANTPSGFQRTEVNASSSSSPPAIDSASPETTSDLMQRAADGFLINGTSNNSASSAFALPPAFGNNRRGPRSLYNGNIGLIVDNSFLDARSFSLTGQDTPKPTYNHLTALVSFGGPIVIPHLLRNGPNLTFNYQWTRNRNAVTQSGLVPTPSERAGELGRPVAIVDPTTGEPFPGNVVPESRISRQAKALLSLYPTPNFAGGSRYNYQIPVIGALHQDSLQTRFNKNLGRNDQLSGNFAYQSTRTDNASLFGFLDTSDTTGINAGVNWRHSFAPRLFVTFGYQYSRLAARVTPFFANRENVSGAAGITGNNQDPLNWGPPALAFSGGIAALSDVQQSLTRNQTNIVSVDSFWNRGRHNISLGADFRRLQFNVLSQQDPRGIFTFTGAATQANVNGVPVAGTGSDFADFLLGIPDTSSLAFGNADKYFRAASYDAYATDDWRISPGFTLNAGVRWEYGSPMTERYGRLVNLDIVPGFAKEAPVVAANPAGPLTGRKYPDSLIRPDKSGFQPRVAISWRPFSASSTVIRAGYGVYYNTSVYLPIVTQMAQQSPLSKSLSVQNTPANPLTLANGFNVSASTTANTFAVDPDFRVGYAQNWQVSIQRDLPAALVATATYLGIKGTRGMQEFLPNTFPVGAPNPCPACPAGYVYLASNGNSTREAGQIQLRRRLHNGISASAQYTFSKAIDDAAFGGRGQAGSVIAQDWLNLRGERGLSVFDQRHLLNMQMQYSTGMGMGGGTLLSGWRGTLFKDWTFVTQINAGSGLPLTPIYPAAVRGTGVTGSIRPDYAGGFVLNPAAYTAPTPGHWGNAGRDSIPGPSQFAFNASMGRTFRSGDRINVDLRIDSMNALNHVTYPSWNTTVTSAQFGLPNTANAMRSVQTTLRLRF
jgi:hypothetical protein